MTADGFHIPTNLIDHLHSSEKIVVLTGAGISAESGVPTFREAKTGLWSQYDPQELATPEAFNSNPELVWKWYTWRQRLIATAYPNAGHKALVSLEEYQANQAAGFVLITQNVDGLHQRAGSRNIIELHGNIFRTRCINQCRRDEQGPGQNTFPPRCPNCNGLLRPDVVWFGENLPREALLQASLASQTCDTFFSIGTSSTVEPAKSLPYGAKQSGAVIIEINPNPTSLSHSADFSLNGPAGIILPEIISSIRRES